MIEPITGSAFKARPSQNQNYASAQIVLELHDGQITKDAACDTIAHVIEFMFTYMPPEAQQQFFRHVEMSLVLARQGPEAATEGLTEEGA